MRDGSAHPVRAFAAAALLGGTLALGGCGGVEFEGRAFEMMGLGSKGEKETEKMADRAPLVMPPKKEQLPEPGPREEIAQPEDWPEDPEVERKKAKAKAEAERKEYYRKGDWSDDRDIEEFDKLFDDSERRPGIFGDVSIGPENRGVPDDADAQ